MKSQTSRTRKALDESLFDNMLDGLAYCQMIFDAQKRPLDFRYIRVNKNFAGLTGLQEAEGKKVTELIPGIAASNPELFEICGRVALHGKPEKFETHIEPLARWFLVSVYSPKKGFFVAVFQNITDRKQIEKDLEQAKVAAQNVLEDLQSEKEALAYAKAKDEAMLASIGDGVIIVDLRGNITFMNQSAQNVLGWKSNEVIGKLLFDVVPIQNEAGELVSAQARSVATTLATGDSTWQEGQHVSTSIKTTPGMYYYVRKDKTKFPVAMNFSSVVLESKIIGAIEVFRDITREKEIDQMKTDFINVAAHDLRTPITAVKGFTQMIRRGDFGPPPGGEIGEALVDIEEGADRMISLVNDFLTVSRIRLGKLKLVRENVNVATLVERAVGEVAVAMKDRPIKIIQRVGDDMPPLQADQSKLLQVLVNLLDNALKHTEQGTITVKAEVTGSFVTFSVSDTGTGIAAADAPHLFEAYYKGGTSAVAAGRGGGLGLGLSICKMIVEAHGGQIGMDSAPGHGSTFFFTLPVAG